ncbi:MAG: hypothetical protein NTV94_18585, partial [Planctomycetota bacterium]|nr:hypothetical protein [Planctomycetota bacterium]
QEFGGAESTVPRYVAAALLGTGATGIVQGVEAGILEKVRFTGLGTKMNWNGPSRFAKFFAAVNALLVAHEAFRNPGPGCNCQFVDDGHDAIIAAYRRNPGLCFDSHCTGPAADGGFLVVCNFDTHSTQQIELDLARVLGGRGMFAGEELLTGSGARYESERLTLRLQPCEAMVIRFTRT